MKRAVIVSGGKKPTRALFDLVYEEDALLIAVDRGAEFFKEEKIRPHLLVGDFDSISEDTLAYFKEREETRVLRYEVEKDYTDTEAALHEAVKKKVKEVFFLGCTGNRLDHFVGNLALLAKALDEGINAYLQDEHNKIFLMNEPGVIEKGFGKYISFQGFRGLVKGFGVKGVKYPLWNYNLAFGDPMTISNEFLKERISVTFTEGVVMVMMTMD